MNDPNRVEPPRRPAIARLFEKSRVPLARLPAVVKMLDEFADRSAAAINRLSPLEVEIEVARVDQGTPKSIAEASGQRIATHFLIREWRAPAIVCFDRMLLFRALDAMYGGDGARRGEAPTRVLTGLEREVAARIGGSVLAELRESIGAVCPFRFALDRVEAPPVAESFESPIDCLLIRLRIVGHEDQIVVALPAGGLEYARDQLSAPGPEVEPDHDPGWTRSFQKNVSATEVELVAVAPGPPMTLGDVARIEPGSLVEFDAECLHHVRVECDELPVFEGRLGQSKGNFTVLLETAILPRKQS